MSSDTRNILLAFKAGRAIRREGTNFVDPQPTKGAVMLYREDDLLHFVWKNRVTGVEEEDLILFPADATFVKVSTSSWGRTYVLKFGSSNQRHFFWLQDASSHRDDEFIGNLNKLLNNPNIIPIWDSRPQASTSTAAPAASTSTTSAPPAAESRTAAVPSGSAASPEQLARLRSLITSMGASGTSNPQSQPDDFALEDILTPANLTPMFTSHPELLPAIFPFLPPDVPQTPDSLQRTINSPQFRAAIRDFDRALRTGLLGGLVRSLGLPEEAGTGVEAFLRAIQAQANRDRAGDGDSMETD
ncbi:adhesion regulating molecule [Hygrophoropsis aurantiaca]|uniref:Adhesion regulating molecule n=1 Tax=Hygrophoropsis aurantiaca TaxID=72124 RepID=A0ACB8ARD3_9AGAM|nr:adhesion regulating molecule [Hygrophoropsis aurantiaca]